MPNQSQLAKAEKESDPKHKHQGQLNSTPEQETASIVAVETPAEPITDDGQARLQAQVSNLSNSQIALLQRQEMAGWMGDKYGNTHMQQVMATMRRNEPAKIDGAAQDGPSHSESETISTPEIGEELTPIPETTNLTPGNAAEEKPQPNISAETPFEAEHMGESSTAEPIHIQRMPDFNLQSFNDIFEADSESDPSHLREQAMEDLSQLKGEAIETLSQFRGKATETLSHLKGEATAILTPDSRAAGMELAELKDIISDLNGNAQSALDELQHQAESLVNESETGRDNLLNKLKSTSAENENRGVLREIIEVGQKFFVFIKNKTRGEGEQVRQAWQTFSALVEGLGKNHPAQILHNLMSQDRLTAEQIDQARTLISQIPDEGRRGDLYEELQTKVYYASQRDNESTENGALVETAGGQMCNLTSLAMALQYLGVPNPYPEMQYEDALEKIRQDRGLAPRTWKAGWEAVAAELGVETELFAWNTRAGKDWYEANVRSRLRQGQAIMLSTKGHIVRVQAVTSEGLVVDDPYGVLNLNTGNFDERNTSRWNSFNERENAGEDAVWNWADVSQYEFFWMASFSI